MILTRICNNRKEKDKTYIQLTTVPNPGFLICCSISLGLMACIPLATAPDWTKIGAKIGNEIDSIKCLEKSLRKSVNRLIVLMIDNSVGFSL